MRYQELLLETGLSRNEIIKHDYFDKLISKIENNEPVVIEPSYRGKYGTAEVTLAPEAAELLQQWQAGGAPSKVPELPIEDSDATILLSHISNQTVRGGAVNLGNLAEGSTGLAITARFANPKKSIIALPDIIQLIKKLKVSESIGTNALEGNFKTRVRFPEKSVSDVVEFKLKLSEAELRSLQDTSESSAATKTINNAIRFANSSESGIAEAIEIIKNNEGENAVEIITDGISENTSTKADLILKINNEEINLISLKAQIKQFGQSGGGHSFPNFIKDFTDIDLKAYSKDLVDTSKLKASPEELKTLTETNFKIIDDLYQKHIVPQLTQAFKSKSKRVMNQLILGILKYATGNKDITIVKYHTNSFSVIKLSPEKLEEIIKDIDFTVTYANNTLKIMGAPKPKSEWYDELGSEPKLFLQIRTRLDRGGTYIRNLAEMGVLFEKLTGEKPQPTPEPTAPITKKPSKPLTAKFTPQELGRRKR